MRLLQPQNSAQASRIGATELRWWQGKILLFLKVACFDFPLWNV
jgi:hypothetical protein